MQEKSMNHSGNETVRGAVLGWMRERKGCKGSI